MPIVADEKPRAGFLTGIGAMLLALSLLVSVCSGDSAGEQEARERAFTVRILACMGAAALAFAGWRVHSSRHGGDHSLVIARTGWGHDDTIEARVEFGMAESVVEAEVTLVRARRGSAPQPAPWTWSPAERPGVITIRGHSGATHPLGLCYIEVKARTVSGRKLRARFLITIH